METQVIKIESLDEKDKIHQAATALGQGKLVVIPTETVYGLGAHGLREDSVKGIFEAKGRPQDNPLILHVANQDQVLDLVQAIPPAAKDCMDMFWPGPLTLIFKRSKIVPDLVTAGLETVAIRMPSHAIAHAILEEAAIPVAAPSANTSGRPSPTRVSHVLEDLDGKVDMIVDGGFTDVGIESTILDVTVDPPTILRPGGVTKEDLEDLLGTVAEDTSHYDAESGTVPKSPGMKYRHYAPQADTTVFAGNIENVAKEINRRIQENKGEKVAVLCTTETQALYQGAHLLLDMGSRSHLEEVAKNLFNSLRACDEAGVDRIYVEGFDFEGLGVGIMNRLLKASGGKVVFGL
ncbi:MAG: L-threonylcarbamoyladenylate synthase [Tissierellia bacterium]|nr:L-threonylcarbamoyladenylate synthase [Tissierellia bacterium]